MSRTSGFSLYKSIGIDDSVSHKQMIKAELDQILNECKSIRGSSKTEISEQLSKLTTKVGVDQLRQKLSQEKAAQIADKLVYDMGHNFPNILKQIYNTDRIRMKDESAEEMEVMQEFELRKVDAKYFLMLEKSKK